MICLPRQPCPRMRCASPRCPLRRAARSGAPPRRAHQGSVAPPPELAEQLPGLGPPARVGRGPAHLLRCTSPLRAPAELLDLLQHARHDCPPEKVDEISRPVRKGLRTDAVTPGPPSHPCHRPERRHGRRGRQSPGSVCSVPTVSCLCVRAASCASTMLCRLSSVNRSKALSVCRCWAACLVTPTASPIEVGDQAGKASVRRRCASIRAKVASGCSICGRWPASGMTSNRPLPNASAYAAP